MKTLMIASGPAKWASARFRVFWPARYMQNIDTITGEDFAKRFPDDYTLSFDNYMFQKHITVENTDKLKEAGKRLFWDMCDPLHWFEPVKSRQITDNCEKVLCSNPGLRDDFNTWYGDEIAIHIPDRMELDHYPLKRQHADVTPVRLIWYGIALNRLSLFSPLVNLERLVIDGYRIELTIFDDRPDTGWQVTDRFPIYHILWNLENENTVIANHDIALLPPYPGPWGHVKSNNKALTAWACGLPATDGLEYERLVDLVTRPELREVRFSPESVELTARELEKIFDVY